MKKHRQTRHYFLVIVAVAFFAALLSVLPDPRAQEPAQQGTPVEFSGIIRRIGPETITVNGLTVDINNVTLDTNLTLGTTVWISPGLSDT